MLRYRSLPHVKFPQISTFQPSLSISQSPWPSLMLSQQVNFVVSGFGYLWDCSFRSTGSFGHEGYKAATLQLGLDGANWTGWWTGDWKSWPPEVRRWWPARAASLAWKKERFGAVKVWGSIWAFGLEFGLFPFYANILVDLSRSLHRNYLLRLTWHTRGLI